jgi:transposase-like zinc-binding protein
MGDPIRASDGVASWLPVVRAEQVEFGHHLGKVGRCVAMVWYLARMAGEDGTGGWPSFVRREFEASLRCGILDQGSLRVCCERCKDAFVVAFSCKGRGFCPSRGGRRMSKLGSRPSARAHPPPGLHRAGAGLLPAGIRRAADANVETMSDRERAVRPRTKQGE